MAKLLRRYRKFVHGKYTYELKVDRAKRHQGRCDGPASFRLIPAGDQRIGSSAGFIPFLEWAAPNSWSEPTQTVIARDNGFITKMYRSAPPMTGAVRVVGGSCLDGIHLGVIQLKEADILRFASLLVEDESTTRAVPDQRSHSAKQIMNRAGKCRGLKHTTMQHVR